MERAPAVVAYTTAVTVTVIGGLTLGEWAMIVGIACAILTFIANTAINIYFKSKHLKIAEGVERRAVEREGTP